MNLLYADTSALARAYFPDESGHEELSSLLLAPVVTSEITQVEFARAVRAAARQGRYRRWRLLIERFEEDVRAEGPVTLLKLRPEAILPVARELVLDHPVRTLDAIHLAVALEEGVALAGADGLVFVTRDRAQARAARALGLSVG